MNTSLLHRATVTLPVAVDMFIFEFEENIEERNQKKTEQDHLFIVFSIQELFESKWFRLSNEFKSYQFSQDNS